MAILQVLKTVTGLNTPVLSHFIGRDGLIMYSSQGSGGSNTGNNFYFTRSNLDAYFPSSYTGTKGSLLIPFWFNYTSSVVYNRFADEFYATGESNNTNSNADNSYLFVFKENSDNTFTHTSTLNTPQAHVSYDDKSNLGINVEDNDGYIYYIYDLQIRRFIKGSVSSEFVCSIPSGVTDFQTFIVTNQYVIIPTNTSTISIIDKNSGNIVESVSISPIINTWGSMSYYFNTKDELIITVSTYGNNAIHYIKVNGITGRGLRTWSYKANGSFRTGSVQTFIVPYTAKYEITAVGATGGKYTYNNTSGGSGAYMKGTFSLTKGDILQIVVGQVGEAFGYTGGGGGGSFVAKGSSYTNATPLIVAGGGGGAGNSGGAGKHATTSIDGVTGYSGYAPGYSGYGSTYNSNGGWGQSGAGFYGNGGGYQSGSSWGDGSVALGFRQGSTGASASSNYNGSNRGTSCIGAPGGYGGGGSGACNGGGGGGGYSGGGAGGGGGGSYNSGTDQQNIAGFNANGNGYVTITTTVRAYIENVKITSNIHSENVKLTANLSSESQNDTLKYRVLVNGNLAYPTTGYITLPSTDESIDIVVQNKFFSIGSNKVEIELTSSLTGEAVSTHTVQMYNNSPNITFLEYESNVHNEDVLVQYKVIDPEGDYTSYKVILNGNQILQDWNALTDYTEPSFLLIKNSYLKTGINVVKFELKDSYNWTNTVNLNINKENNKPEVIVNSLQGYRLNFDIEDSDGDNVAFRILINDEPRIPESGFSDFLPTPYNREIIIPANMINVNEYNKVTVEIKDDVGETNSIDLSVIFQYAGLVFCDVDETVYSDDIGTILKILEHEPLVAGNKSEWIEVWLKNNMGYNVKDITLTVDQGVLDPILETVELAYPTISEEPVQEINIGDLLPEGKKSFFIRVNAHRKALTGGEFFVYCKGYPTK
jgi:hypothetical protein